MKNPNRLKHIIWSDAIRIVAVFSVIVLHNAAAGSEYFGARTVEWQICNFYNSIVRFAVPVFVMVSGMFLLDPAKEYDIKKLYCTKILRIVTAYLFWSAFYSLISIGGHRQLSGLFGYTGIHNNSIVHSILIGPFHLWFLFMISGLYIVTPFLRVIVKDERLTLYFFACSLVFVCGTSLVNLFPAMRKIVELTITRLDVNLLASFSGYYVWGNWLSRHRLQAFVRKIIYLMGAFSAIGTVVLNGYAGYHYNVPRQLMYGHHLPNILMMSKHYLSFASIVLKQSIYPHGSLELLLLLANIVLESFLYMFSFWKFCIKLDFRIFSIILLCLFLFFLLLCFYSA